MYAAPPQVRDVNDRFVATCDRQPFSDGDEAANSLRASAKAGGVLCEASVQDVAVPAVDISELGVADADRVLQHCREHRFEIAGEPLIA